MRKTASNFAFIDGQNLYQSITRLGWKLDFKKFRIYLREKYHVQEALYFIGYIKSQTPLYQFLSDAGFRLMFKQVQELPGQIKGNVDVDLTLHTLVEFPNYDQAVIVTGDGDFACLVEYLNLQNKLHRLLVPNKNEYSKFLRRMVPNKIDFVNELQKVLEYRNKNRGQMHKD